MPVTYWERVKGFGSAVAIDGNILIVGAPQDNSEGTDTGAAYVFVRDATTSAWQKEAKLTASDAGAGATFGQSVEVGGSSVIAGPAGGSTDGAYVFVRSGTTWGQEQKIKGEQDAFLAAHPDLYENSHGAVRVRIEDGMLAIGSLDCAGYASKAAPDWSGMRETAKTSATA